MKKYNVNVNGNLYEITLEVVDVDAASVPAPAPVSAPAPAAAPAPVAAPAAPAGNGTTVNAPMPGTILGVKVQNGASVKKGDVLFILEAMKMENEIMAPCDGVVSGVTVMNGANVETGATLCVIG